ncbi:hypothetical protein HPB49_013008 [Dermacentor silvarum]|uniref:Uncharacterized protein n=1 Tax=Dermacentor silvarum TaxID=543639 RepID=A0ACB8C9G4_DERSI|nr:hypothetical protein HPB49_013008 [Dermacentor silvarum]
MRGLFDNADDEQEFAFRVTIERINNDNGVLLRSRLVPRIERLDKDDSFRATKKDKNRLTLCVSSGINAELRFTPALPRIALSTTYDLIRTYELLCIVRTLQLQAL